MLTGNSQQIEPMSSNGVDTVNFRHLKESHSLHLEGVAGAGKGLELGPLDDDLFEAFSSVTLHHDGDD